MSTKSAYIITNDTPEGPVVNVATGRNGKMRLYNRVRAALAHKLMVPLADFKRWRKGRKEVFQWKP